MTLEGVFVDDSWFSDLVERQCRLFDDFISESDNEEFKSKLEKTKEVLRLAEKLADLELLLETYELGDKEYLPYILSFCLEHKLEIPPQIVNDITTAAAKLRQATNCLNEAFSHQPGRKRAKERLKSENAIKIYELAVLMRAKNPTLAVSTTGLFAEISESFGGKLSPDQVSVLYYLGEKDYKLRDQAQVTVNLKHSIKALQLAQKLLHVNVKI